MIIPVNNNIKERTDSRLYQPPFVYMMQDGGAKPDPALPATPVYYFDSRDVDGQKNKSLSDGAAISTWKNKGSASDATQSGSLRPTISKTTGPNSVDMVVFDGLTQYLTLPNSDTQTNFIQNTAVFEQYVVFYRNSLAYGSIVGNSLATSAKGFENFLWSDTRQQYGYTIGSGSIAGNSSTPALWGAGAWKKSHWKGNGAGGVINASADLTNYIAGFSVGGLATGNSTRIAFFGAINTGSAEYQLPGKICLYMLYDRILTPTERAQVSLFITTIYGI